MTRNIVVEIKNFESRAEEIESLKNSLIAEIETQLSTFSSDDFDKSDDVDSISNAYIDLLYTLGADLEESSWHGGVCEIWIPSTC